MKNIGAVEEKDYNRHRMDMMYFIATEVIFCSSLSMNYWFYFHMSVSCQILSELLCIHFIYMTTKCFEYIEVMICVSLQDTFSRLLWFLPQPDLDTFFCGSLV